MSPGSAPPVPPTVEQERKLARLLRWGFSDDLYAQPQEPPPAAWGAQPFGVPRRTGGLLAGLLFPHEEPRGVLLLGHPAVASGKSFFHATNRIPFARSLGCAVVTFDHGGFGESDGPTSLYHTEWEDVLGWARRRFPDVLLHVWGVGLSGYFAHHAVARDPGLASAIFEEVAPAIALGVTARISTRMVTPVFAPWLPAEAHAHSLHAERVLYAYGDADAELPAREAERLWKAAGPLATRHVVEGAGRLETWKKGGEPLREAIRKTIGP